jgi:AraC-like DNA-binding protein
MPEIDSLSFDARDTRPDPDTFEEVRVIGASYGFCRLTTPWGTSIPTLPTARLHVVTHGECLIRIEGGAWIGLEAGDLAFLPLGNAHALADSPERTLRPLSSYPTNRIADQVYELVDDNHDGSTTRLSCSEFIFDPDQSALLPLLMPSIMIVRSSTDQDRLLKLLIQEIAREVGEADFGRSTMLRRLADLLVTRILRLTWTGRADSDRIPILHADREIADALRRLLQRPYAEWSVTILAGEVGVSRSRLTARFSRAFGMSPSSLLRQVRLSRAASAIRVGSTGLEQVAEDFGYSDASALSRAYKAMFGASPRAAGR